MAASLSMRCCLLNTRREVTEDRVRAKRGVFVSSVHFPCQGNEEGMEKDDNNQSKGEGDKRFRVVKSLGEVVQKMSKGVKDSLSPKQKGDWKDVLLMSISFAVYVYMSQQIVCAYCVWISMFKQHW